MTIPAKPDVAAAAVVETPAATAAAAEAAVEATAAAEAPVEAEAEAPVQVLPPQRVLTPKDQVKNDFLEYWNGAEKSRLLNPVAQRILIASAHKYAMCFFYLSRPMASLDAHQRIFFQELTSDAVHLVHALTGGDARGGRFYLRSVIENFWRHHYFRDHIVEYGWLHTRDKYFLEMRQLREHCSWLPCFQGKAKSLIADLPGKYADLSTSVHSSSSRTLVLRQTLNDIHLADEQGKSMSKDLLGTFKVCLALSVISEKDVFLGLHVNTQEFLMASLSVAHKKIVREVLETA
jgi:hypothetical protein